MNYYIYWTDPYDDTRYGFVEFTDRKKAEDWITVHKQDHPDDRLRVIKGRDCQAVVVRVETKHEIRE